VQVKVPVDDVDAVEERLLTSGIEIIKQSVRQQFDTYFLFEAGTDDRYLRYREDNELIDAQEEGRVGGLSVRPTYTLTLIEGIKEREFQDSVILSRSRYTAQATYSLRFYREYFAPKQEYEIVKWRKRYRVKYEGTEFAINIDRVTRPQGLGNFLEIKARTWSASDAERKAYLVSQLLRLLGLRPDRYRRGDYLDWVR
ncbi:MAG: amidohydrolase, partial [Anaerolineae bacterium]|nr:amidohydrolase [Anaerolineae bacterium]